MKYLSLILISFGVLCSAIAVELPKSLLGFQKDLQDKIKILSVDDDDFKNDADERFFILKIRSSQDERETDLRPVMRVTVKLFDRKTGVTVFAQKELKSKRLPGNDRYAGSTQWEFQIPYDGMKRPKLVAYAVEFGVTQDGTFVPGATEYDKVDSAEEIMSGEGTEVYVTTARCDHETNSN